LEVQNGKFISTCRTTIKVKARSCLESQNLEGYRHFESFGLHTAVTRSVQFDCWVVTEACLHCFLNYQMYRHKFASNPRNLLTFTNASQSLEVKIFESIVTMLQAGRPGFESRQEHGLPLPSPPPPDWLWYRRLYRGKATGTRSRRDSPPSRADVTDVWSYTSAPLYNFMAWCLITSYNNNVI